MSLLVHYIIHNEVQSFLICILNGNVVVAVNQIHRQPGLSLDITKMGFTKMISYKLLRVLL